MLLACFAAAELELAGDQVQVLDLGLENSVESAARLEHGQEQRAVPAVLEGPRGRRQCPHDAVLLLHQQRLRLRPPAHGRPDQAGEVGLGVARLVQVAEQAAKARSEGVDGRSLLPPPVGALERLRRGQEGGDRFVVELLERRLTALCAAPGGEQRHVPSVLLNRVRGPTVRAELDHEPLQAVFEMHDDMHALLAPDSEWIGNQRGPPTKIAAFDHRERLEIFRGAL